ncbi:MAG: hemolysin III family protein [Candidatus Muirbacterium halophilum]|nr:hemolysin III family protein [Candidatus Muirbacterium halophilum]
MYKGEKFNSISHLVGAVFALIGLIIIVVIASVKGDIWQIVSFSIYGSSLFLLYLFSTLYHSFKGKAKKVFRVFDHISIYLLIAGTYTPFTLISLKGPWGWTIFGISWGLAVIGIICDILMRKSKKRTLSLIIYLLMGWVILIALKPLLSVLPIKAFALLLIGGLFYTGGIVFYVLDKKYKEIHFHGIWHLFVLTGSVFHYITILAFLI